MQKSGNKVDLYTTIEHEDLEINIANRELCRFQTHITTKATKIGETSQIALSVFHKAFEDLEARLKSKVENSIHGKLAK